MTKSYWGVLVLGFIASASTMCGGRSPSEEMTPRPDTPIPIAPIAPPTNSLRIDVPETDWTPVTYRNPMAGELVAALERYDTLAIVLPKKGNPAELENRVFQMLKSAAPDTEVVAHGTASLTSLLDDQENISYRGAMVSGSAAENDTAVPLPPGHPLVKDWLSKKKQLKGAKGVLVIRPLAVSDDRIKALRKDTSGSCEAMETALRVDVDEANTFFADYTDKASSSLLREFRRQLEPALPFWRSELEKMAALSELGSPEDKCRVAYTELLDEVENCMDGVCSVAPKLYTTAGGVVGMPDPGLTIPPVCPTPGMRDFASELNTVADRAVTEVLPALGTRWAGELARMEGLVRMENAIRERCVPAHRRISAAMHQAAKAAVRKYLETLNEKDITAGWESMGGKIHVPGKGPVNVFARVKVSAGDPSVDAVDVRQLLRDMVRCDGSNDRVFQATVVDVVSRKVTFMGLFFEEQLLCEAFRPE